MDEKRYKLSIITINYNNADGLYKTAESVRKQTCKQFEWIVIDGGSTDNSVEIIRKYETDISNWVSERDKGIYNAMNKGVSYASGEYCLFLNSGDILFSEDSIKRLLTFDLTADIISSNLMKKGQNYTYAVLPDCITYNFMIGTSLPHPSTLIKRDHLIKNPYNENYKIISDWAFFFDELIIRDASYQHLDFPLSVFFLDGISNTNRKKGVEERKIHLMKYFPQKYVEEQLSFDKGDTFIRASNGFYSMNRSFIEILCKLIYGLENIVIKPLFSTLYVLTHKHL